MKRTSYDTAIIWLYANQKEHLLPVEFRNRIPSSTISDFRNRNYSNYFGSEHRQIIQEALEYYELFSKYQKINSTLLTISKTWRTISKNVLPLLHKNKNISENLLNETQRLFSALSKKSALKIFGFTRSGFQYRIAKAISCTGSPIELCVKRIPQQLSNSETSKITELFQNPKFKCWPMSSLYYEGLRNLNLNIGLSTFYKYARLMNLSRKFIVPKELKVGIQSSRPNEYLHVDTTFYHHLDSGKKAAIVFVSDNFSRLIMGAHVNQNHNSKNVYIALSQAIQTIHTHHPGHHCLTTLVADGGSENNNQTIDELIQSTKKPPFQKVIAKKDIEYSNSPIEAINKIAKRYLRYLKPRTIQELEKIVLFIIEDYNTYRPHGALKGLTPLECYCNISPLDFKPQIKAARLTRRVENKKNQCYKC
jgi:hypothetical protein